MVIYLQSVQVKERGEKCPRSPFAGNYEMNFRSILNEIFCLFCLTQMAWTLAN
jgi:hypothetical protein